MVYEVQAWLITVSQCSRAVQAYFIRLSHPLNIYVLPIPSTRAYLTREFIPLIQFRRVLYAGEAELPTTNEPE